MLRQENIEAREQKWIESCTQVVGGLIPGRFDLYLSTVYLGFFIGGLAVFVTLFVAVDALSSVAQFKDVGLDVWGRYYLFYLPEAIHKMIPVGNLLALVFTLSGLAKANELVALYSMGHGLVRVVRPLMVWIIFVSLGNYYLGDRIVPNSIQQKNYLFYHDIKKQPSLLATVKTDRIWYRSKDTIYNIRKLDPETRKAYGLTLYYFTKNWDLSQMLTAKEVQLGVGSWTLSGGSVTVFTDSSSFPMTQNFETKIIVMDETAKDLGASQSSADSMNRETMRQFINKNKEAGLIMDRMEVDYHAKTSYPASGVVMAVLGVPFSVSSNRRQGGVLGNIGMVIGLVFFFWISYSSSIALGHYGHLNPLVAAWLPNIFCGLLGLFFMLRRSAR